MVKFLAAAAFAAGLSLAAIGNADAKVNVDIGIGIGGPFFVDPYPVYDWGYPVYYSKRYVTCGQGARIVRASGFRDVEARDCRGDTYMYRAKAKGYWNRVYVRASNGRIVAVRRF